MKSDYKWSYQNVGSTTRIKIQSGEDIRHLGELDQKMWTVLSCPVQGLEIDSKSLQYIDVNGDGKIHVQDVIATANYLCSVLQDPEVLLDGKDELALTEINAATDAGKQLLVSAKAILRNLGKEETVISPADTADSLAIFAKTRFNGDGIITPNSTDDEALKTTINAILATIGNTPDRSGEAGISADQIEAFYAALAAYKAWCDSKPVLPFDAHTDAALANYNALNDKVKDYFLRQRLANFSEASAAVLDIQTDHLLEDYATQPLAHVTGKDGLDLTAVINPAWADKFNALKAIAFEEDMKVLTEEAWMAIGQKFAAYIAWQGAKAGAEVESLGLETIIAYLKADKKAELLALVAEDKAVEAEANAMAEVDKLTHLKRDFCTLLKNFVTLDDFYSKDKLAVFQVGTLIVDQRACRFCMRVADMGKHTAMAPASGMYLIYCDCTTKTKAGTLQIVAAMTQGDTGDLMVGKNCIFYDRDGLDWDAVITKIVDNPISIGQAFWSPYRRMAKFVEDLINKRAAEKDSKMMDDATTQILAKADAPADPAAPKQPFDIAKFAGIFAALGMALGMIGTALVSLATGIAALKWWQLLLAIVAIMLIISGPAMIMAWMKLRRRNIAPLLNANGWAVNASSLISIPFGATLTDIAHYPKLKLQDPFKKQGMACWKKWVLALAMLIVVLAGLWLGNLLAWAKLPSPLPCFHKEVAEEVVTEEIMVETMPAEAIEIVEDVQ